MNSVVECRRSLALVIIKYQFDDAQGSHNHHKTPQTDKERTMLMLIPFLGVVLSGPGALSYLGFGSAAAHAQDNQEDDNDDQ